MNFMETNSEICEFIQSDFPGGFCNLSLFLNQTMISIVDLGVILLAKLTTFFNICVQKDADIILPSENFICVNKSQICNANSFN